MVAISCSIWLALVLATSFEAVLILLMALAAGCGGSQKDAASSGEKVLKVGTTADFAPFEFQDADGKEYQGFDMDLIRALGKEMGYKVEIQNLNFDGLIPSLETGNVDVVVSGMTSMYSVMLQRKRSMWFIAVPMAITG